MKNFSGQIKDWYNWYLTTRGINQYAINSIIFLTTVREKYVKMYERFLNQLKQYAQAMSIVKGILTHITLITLKIKSDTTKGKTSSTD